MDDEQDFDGAFSPLPDRDASDDAPYGLDNDSGFDFPADGDVPAAANHDAFDGFASIDDFLDSAEFGVGGDDVEGESSTEPPDVPLDEQEEFQEEPDAVGETEPFEPLRVEDPLDVINHETISPTEADETDDDAGVASVASEESGDGTGWQVFFEEERDSSRGPNRTVIATVAIAALSLVVVVGVFAFQAKKPQVTVGSDAGSGIEAVQSVTPENTDEGSIAGSAAEVTPAESTSEEQDTEEQPEATEEQETETTETKQRVWVVDKPAYDERVLVKGAYDEQVVSKQAYDEQVLVSEGWYETTDSGTVYHPPVYNTVHHDAQYTTVHHNAQYTTVHHDEEGHWEYQ